MLVVCYSDKFLKSAKTLPKNLQIKLASLLEILESNPFNSKLHTKNLVGNLAGFFSFRIIRDWRVIFKFISPTEIQLLTIAHRKDIYR